jgi:hypothetical protein
VINLFYQIEGVKNRNHLINTDESGSNANYIINNNNINNDFSHLLSGRAGNIKM